MSAPDPLVDGFRDPPMSARPRVWWHWMNGNVTPEGIALDLAWMKRVGIGGVQNFDAALATPQIVDQRLAYMTPAWRAAFAGAVAQADAAGLEFGIASSPGWSETGGPWVPPEDGIKKFVWSATTVDGGAATITVPPPPSVTGPFQAVAKRVDPIAAKRDGAPPAAYCDTVVLGFPATGVEAITATRRAGESVHDVRLRDGSTDEPFELRGTPGQPLMVRYDFTAATMLRSATLAFDSGGTLFTPPRYKAALETSVDGIRFERIADFPTGPTPQYSISFPGVSARAARIVFTPQPPGELPFTPVAGAIKLGVGGSAAGEPGVLRVDGVGLSRGDRIHRWEEKAGFEAPFDYYALDTHAGTTGGIDPEQVVDLTSRLRPNGRLDWVPPPGRWTVLRFGWSLTGKENHPATLEATGLEVDKYDGAAVGRYIDHYLDTYAATVGPGNIGQKGIRSFLNDSIEVGPANWTPALLSEFRSRRGYSALPWLPALTGTIVGDAARSDAFLYDFRRTLADLIAEKHYATIADRAHARGLRTYGEALEFGRPSLGDDMAMRRHADVPMAAMWTYPPADRAPRAVYRADIRGAASVAHIYGQNFVAAKSLTSAWAPWAFAPADLKPMIDMEFALGVNLPVIHTSVHQPVTAKAPGLSLAIFGQYFNRLESWSEQARPWIDYIARSAFMLQQGRSVAGVLYFYGEEAPLTALYNAAPPPDAPRTHDWDFANPDVLLTQVRVDGHALVTRSGQRYPLLWLGGTSERMTLPVLRRVLALVHDGAIVAGKRATRSPSLADDPRAFAAVAADLWGPPGEVIDRTVGRGRVLAATDAEDALRLLGRVPDVAITGAADAEILFKHRLLASGEHTYFLSNRRDRRERVEVRLGVTGRVPALWHADTGRTEAATWQIDRASTVVALDLAPQQAVFIVLRQPTRATRGAAPDTVRRPLAQLVDGWSLAFPGEGLAAASLGSWTDDPARKYTTATARYTRSLRIDPAWSARGLEIDLGEVGDVAEVLIDGRSAGIAWHAPNRIDLTPLALTPGEHRLEVRVTNLWVNRLIGDAQPDAVRTTFTALPTYRKDAPLRRSGLMGPVTLLSSAAE